jgi:hypothetical protein
MAVDVLRFRSAEIGEHQNSMRSSGLPSPGDVSIEVRAFTTRRLLRFPSRVGQGVTTIYAAS